MTPPRRRQLLQRKLTSLGTYLSELATILPGTPTEYLSNTTTRRAVERLIQVIVEAAADSADLLLAEESHPAGDTAREIFEALRAAGIVDDALGRRFAYEHSALRNRIVHDYDELDNPTVWQAAGQLVPDGRALVAELTARLSAALPRSG
jgi:uncharacterized protein YutE (UPF0331/DUF86 family)